MSGGPLYALITGGNAGLGFETAKSLLKSGYHVTITARSKDKAEYAIQEILKELPASPISYELLELKSLESVHEFGQAWRSAQRPLHLLINNAGIMNTPYEMTANGIEAQFQVNHLGHFVLTHYLLPSLTSTAAADHVNNRVVSLSSRAHLRWNKPFDINEVTTVTASTYDGWEAYGRSKLSNILFTKSLAKRFPVDTFHVTFNSLHPGLVATKLLDVSPGLSSQAITVEEGIQGILQLSLSPEVEGITGEYFHDGHIATGSQEVSSWAFSIDEANKLWNGSLALTGLDDKTYGV